MPKKKKLIRTIAERDMRIHSLEQDLRTLIYKPNSERAVFIKGRVWSEDAIEKAVWFGDATANIPKL